MRESIKNHLEELTKELPEQIAEVIRENEDIIAEFAELVLKESRIFSVTCPPIKPKDIIKEE